MNLQLQCVRTRMLRVEVCWSLARFRIRSVQMDKMFAMLNRARKKAFRIFMASLFSSENLFL